MHCHTHSYTYITRITPSKPACAAQGAANTAFLTHGSLKTLRCTKTHIHHQVNQLVLRKVLQAVLPGTTPDVVANGLQVLEAVAVKSYDLILMDSE